MNTGLNLFVFCTTTEEGSNSQLDSKFGPKKIHIREPDAFSLAVAQKLTDEIIKIQTIKISERANSISYGHHSVIYRTKPPLTPEEIEDSRVDLTQVFIKEPQAYENEKEHRFIWFPEDNVENKLCNLPMSLDYLDLEFPEIWDYIDEA